MPTSTYYINAFIIFSLLSIVGCSQRNHDTPENIKQPAGSTKIKTDPKTEIQSYQQAITHLNDNRLDEAESILLNFTKHQPELAGPWANLGLIQLKQNNIDEAEELVKKAIAKNPDMTQALHLLAIIENKRGNIKKSEQLYLQAIQHKPNYAIAHYNLALLYDIYLQKRELAIIHYQKYLALIDYKDQRTADWLNELNRLQERGNS